MRRFIISLVDELCQGKAGFRRCRCGAGKKRTRHSGCIEMWWPVAGRAAARPCRNIRGRATLHWRQGRFAFWIGRRYRHRGFYRHPHVVPLPAGRTGFPSAWSAVSVTDLPGLRGIWPELPAPGGAPIPRFPFHFCLLFALRMMHTGWPAAGKLMCSALAIVEGLCIHRHEIPAGQSAGSSL